MAARQTSPKRLKSVAGALLLAVGFLILSANLDAVGGQIANAAGNSREHTSEMMPALVLATMHALQAYSFDQAGFLSGVLQILVSFWPLILIILGAALLRDAFWGRFEAYKNGAGSPAGGER
jgi:hypothetical protein